MKLSMAAEFAVRGILCLVEDYGRGALPLDEICQRRGLPKQYLIKLFGMLGRADLVDALRGKGGGYVLARPPNQISLLEVIEAVEGPLAVNLCQNNPAKCDEPDCRVRPVWDEVQHRVRSALAGTTLDNLVRPAAG